MLIFLTIMSVCSGKLVLKSEDDLSAELVMAEADKLRVERVASQHCPGLGLEEELTHFEYFVLVDGVEERREDKAIMLIDATHTTMEMYNIGEPWVKGAVKIR